MVRRVRQKAGVGLREERSPSSVAFRQDDFVEELDGWVLGATLFALVNEFVESLRLSQHVHVLAVAMWDAPQELLHVEVVDHSLSLMLARSRMHIATISVKK